ncbi:MAG: hypothetical protein R3F61_29520 [Myxococcota bacterium]
MHTPIVWLLAACHTTEIPSIDTDLVRDTDVGADTDVPMPVDVPVVLPPELPPAPLVPFLGFSRSGTRLEALAWETSEGVLLHRGFHDTLLDRSCLFQQTSETTWHCLPTSGLMTGRTFEDPACTGSGAMRSAYPDCEPDPWEHLFQPTDPECGRGYSSVHEVGEPVTVPSTADAFSLIGDVCLPAGPWALAPAFAVGPEVPLDTFVSAERVVVEVAARVYVGQLRGEDGSMRVLHPVTRYDEPCSPRDTDAGRRCVPQSRVRHAPDGYFADPACSAPVGVGTPARCTDEWVAYEEHDDGTLSLWTRGPEIPHTEPLYRKVDGACLSTAPPDSPVHWLSQPVDASDYPEVWLETLGTTLTQEWWMTLYGVRVSPASDSASLGPLTCDLAPIDGSTAAACFPAFAIVSATDLEYHADPTCTQPLLEHDDRLVGELVFPDCSPDLPTLTDPRGAGAPHTGPVYRASGAGCTEVTSPPALFTVVEGNVPTLTRVPPFAP